MSLGALEPQFWKAFCEAVAQPQWDQSHYFKPGPHQGPLIEAVAALFNSALRRNGWHTSPNTTAAVNRC